jgi:hypothetical protein
MQFQGNVKHERHFRLNSKSGHQIQRRFKGLSFCAAAFISLLAWMILLSPGAIRANQVPVRYAQGAIHGFLVLQTLDGETLADGDLTQMPKGDRVTGHLVFHFKDGSLYDETFVFTQRGTFRLLSDHLVMKGPTFKQPMETSLNTSTGVATVRYTDDDGKEKVVNAKQPLPTDLANGMIPILATNLQPSAPETKVSMLAATPKPRLVTLAFTPAGDESFLAGGATRKARHYVMKIEIGGVAGVVAPIVGKQPPDTNVWVSAGDAPVFLKMEGALYEGGPIWRILPVSPAWPKAASQGGH